MEFRIFTKDNYFYINDVDNNIQFEALKKDVLVRKKSANSTSYSFTGINGWNDTPDGLSISLIKKEDGSDYTTSEFETLYKNETGLSARVIPQMANGGHISIQTAANGTDWVAFENKTCKQLNVSNQTGNTIEVRQDGSGVGLQIPTGAFYTFFGLVNSNQLSVRRLDLGTGQLTVTARWEL